MSDIDYLRAEVKRLTARYNDAEAEMQRLREAIAGSPDKAKRLISLVAASTRLVQIERDDAQARAEAAETNLADDLQRLAAAWQEGFDAGENMAHMWGHIDNWPAEDWPENPYAEAEQAALYDGCRICDPDDPCIHVPSRTETEWEPSCTSDAMKWKPEDTGD